MDRYPYLLGCLLGTALGDAAGLRREGLSRQRADRMYGNLPIAPQLILGHGFCSDDTEHTQMVGRALVSSAGDVPMFEQHFARQLKCWMLTLPAGVGWATLRSCIKLLLGLGAARSGVFSAGNGPAMRSALIGAWTKSSAECEGLVRSCTRMTHTDPKAEVASLLIAKAASLKAHRVSISPIEFLETESHTVTDDELGEYLRSAVVALEAGKTSREFADSQGWSRGVSGYINHSVPAALYCWASYPNDFCRCVESAVLLGGDTDTIAAIAGAVCGANLGADELPRDWLDALVEWPRNLEWMESLAKSLSNTTSGSQAGSPPSMRWLATIPRNIVFAFIVLGLGFRRLLPPY